VHADQQAGGLRWGVEPICRVLSEHGLPIAPSTYYAARTAGQQHSTRVQRDEHLKGEVRRVHADNFGVYGHARSGLPSTAKASRSPAARWSD